MGKDGRVVPGERGGRGWIGIFLFISRTHLVSAHRNAICDVVVTFRLLRPIQAFALIDMAASVAFAVGPVLGSVLYTHLDYRYVCLIEAGLILAAAPLIVWTRPRNADAPGRIYE